MADISEPVDAPDQHPPPEDAPDEQGLDVPASPPARDRELPGGRRGERRSAATGEPSRGDVRPAADRDPARDASAPAPSGVHPEHPDEATTDEDPGGQVGG